MLPHANSKSRSKPLNMEVGLTWNITTFGYWLACSVAEQTNGLQLFWVEMTGGLERREEKAPPEGCEVRMASKYIWNFRCGGDRRKTL